MKTILQFLADICLFIVIHGGFGADDFDRKYVKVNVLEESVKEKVMECYQNQSVPFNPNLETIDVTFENLDDTMLCVVKCIHTALGYLDKNGNLVRDAVKECTAFFKVEEFEKDIITRCYNQNITTIETCEDMKKVGNCWKLIFL